MPESSWLSPRRRPMRGRGPGSAAFTLIEMLGVLAIVGILLGIVFALGQGVQERGRVARARAELAVLAAALDSYKLQYGDYPRTPTGGALTNEQILFNALCGKQGPGGAPIDGRVFVELAKFNLLSTADEDLPAAGGFGLLENSFRDPWDRPYVYVYKTSSDWDFPSFVLYSDGAEPDDNAGTPDESDGLIVHEDNGPSVVDGADDLIAGR